MNQEFIQANKRRIILGTMAFIGILIMWTIVILISRIGKVPVVVSVVPSDAKVVIDGQSFSNGTQWLTAGTYEMDVDRDGFAKQKKTITVSSDKTQNVAAASLEPESNEAKKWADDHKNDYKNNEKYGAIEASANGKYFTEQNPITMKLPFTDPYFTIGYKAKEDNSIIVKIVTPSPRYRFYAVEQIRQWGYDPTELEIQFTDFRNPLEAK